MAGLDVLDELFSLLGRASQVAPNYKPAFCIAVKKSVGACSVCRDVCPHEAITIGQQVVIDEVDCTGCGLCVEACPSQALSAADRLRPDGMIRCSQVSGDAQSVTCLTRLQPTDLLRIARGHERVTMARGDCANCPVGDSRVIAAIENVAEDAGALAGFRSRPLSVEVVEVAELANEGGPPSISRRDLFRLGGGGLRDQATETFAAHDVGATGDATLPQELRNRYNWLRQVSPSNDTLVPWTLPRVSDACILCPVCTNVCPTKAFERDLDPVDQGPAQLWFSPERCNGCNACVASCPVNAMTLGDEITWGEVRKPTVLAKRGNARRAVPT